MEVPTSFSFTGWKHARLVATTLPTTEGPQVVGVRFLPLHPNLPYGPDDAARCIFDTAEEKHCPPEPNCGCGFYALKDRSRIVSGDYSGAVLFPSQVLLNVGFYGTVVEGQFGFRASHQRVLEVFVSEVCSRCRIRPVSLFAVLLPSSDPDVYEDCPVVSTCDVCVPNVRVTVPAVFVSRQEVERHLGVLVRFDPSLPPPTQPLEPPQLTSPGEGGWLRRVVARLFP